MSVNQFFTCSGWYLAYYWFFLYSLACFNDRRYLSLIRLQLRSCSRRQAENILAILAALPIEIMTTRSRWFRYLVNAAYLGVWIVPGTAWKFCLAVCLQMSRKVTGLVIWNKLRFWCGFRFHSRPDNDCITVIWCGSYVSSPPPPQSEILKHLDTSLEVHHLPGLTRQVSYLADFDWCNISDPEHLIYSFLLC